MFCPKCGTKNPDDGKYCRSCGLDISGVATVIETGGSNLMKGLEKSLASLGSDMSCDDSDDKALKKGRRADPSEVYGDGIKNVISGVGFLVVSIALLLTGVAGGKVWWWALLFPAFTFLARGISELLKSKRMVQNRNASYAAPVNHLHELEPPQNNAAFLPSSETTYVSSADSRYKTGDLVPPSVTDNTTKLLEMEEEAKTKTLI